MAKDARHVARIKSIKLPEQDFRMLTITFKLAELYWGRSKKFHVWWTWRRSKLPHLCLLQYSPQDPNVHIWHPKVLVINSTYQEGQAWTTMASHRLTGENVLTVLPGVTGMMYDEDDCLLGCSAVRTSNPTWCTMSPQCSLAGCALTALTKGGQTTKTTFH
jgi:hypothetical protein